MQNNQGHGFSKLIGDIIQNLQGKGVHVQAVMGPNGKYHYVASKELDPNQFEPTADQQRLDFDADGNPIWNLGV